MPVARTKPNVEWPTLALVVVIYGGWLSLTLFHAYLPTPLLFVLGGWFTAWQSGLQHETIHGHPTSSRRINRLIGLPPLILLIPYESYRRSHLVHHIDERLTDPIDDPESYYWTPEAWAALPPPLRMVVSWQTTLLGRLLMGPFWVGARFLASEARQIAAGDRARRRIWLWHMAHVALLIAWILGVCGMSLSAYAACFVYPGLSLMLLRSFAEHRAGEAAPERIALIENAPLLSLLYLNNNLHAAHHENPMIAWHEIPRWHRANRARLVSENGGLVYDGYLDVARRYLLRPHDHPVHPFGRVGRA